jgi:tRNA(fMet)-specific endonuclease VapC
VIIVDADVLIDVLKNRAPMSVSNAARRGALSTTAIVAYEVRRGARTDKTRDSVELLLRQMRSIEPFDDVAAAESAALYRELSRSGQVIGKPDLYIAGICLAVGARLLTRNVREYSRVPGLQLVEP